MFMISIDFNPWPNDMVQNSFKVFEYAYQLTFFYRVPNLGFGQFYTIESDWFSFLDDNCYWL